MMYTIWNNLVSNLEKIVLSLLKFNRQHDNSMVLALKDVTSCVVNTHNNNLYYYNTHLGEKVKLGKVNTYAKGKFLLCGQILISVYWFIKWEEHLQETVPYHLANLVIALRDEKLPQATFNWSKSHCVSPLPLLSRDLLPYLCICITTPL